MNFFKKFFKIYLQNVYLHGRIFTVSKHANKYKYLKDKNNEKNRYSKFISR